MRSSTKGRNDQSTHGPVRRGRQHWSRRDRVLHPGSGSDSSTDDTLTDTDAHRRHPATGAADRDVDH